MHPFPEMANLIVLTVALFSIPWLWTRFVPVIKTLDSSETPPREVGGRYRIYDIIRGIAILAVIVIHVTYLYPPGDGWVSQGFLDVLDASMRFTIPIFFLLSGMLLKPIARSLPALATFYSDKLLKLGIPYLLVCLTLLLVTTGSVTGLLSGMLTGSLSVPFYFMVVLFQLYLIYPFVEPLAHKRPFVYIALGISVFTQLVPPLWYAGEVPFMMLYFFFFVWGIYMRAHLLKERPMITLWPWLTLLGLFWVLYALFPGQYYNMQPYYGLSVFMLLVAVLQKINLQKPVEQFLAWAGQTSLWIFLLHFPLMEYLVPRIVQSALPETAAFVTALIGSILVSIAAAFLADRIYSFLFSRIRKPQRV